MMETLVGRHRAVVPHVSRSRVLPAGMTSIGAAGLPLPSSIRKQHWHFRVEKKVTLRPARKSNVVEVRAKKSGAGLKFAGPLKLLTDEESASGEVPTPNGKEKLQKLPSTSKIAAKGRGRSKDNTVVFVAGATGVVGRRVVRELLQQGYSVRAGVRNSETADFLLEFADVSSNKEAEQKPTSLWSNFGPEKIFGFLSAKKGPGVELVEVDLEDSNVDEIEEALGNAGVVICTVGASEKEPFNITAPYRLDFKATESLINAATNAKVKHFVLVSSIGTNKVGWPVAVLNLFWGVLIWKGKAEKALIESGIPFTIVRPGGMEKPTDTYKETHNLVLDRADSRFYGQVSSLQVAELIGGIVNNFKLSQNKILEVVAETTAPLRDIEDLLAEIPSIYTTETDEETVKGKIAVPKKAQEGDKVNREEIKAAKQRAEEDKVKREEIKAAKQRAEEERIAKQEERKAAKKREEEEKIAKREELKAAKEREEEERLAAQERVAAEKEKAEALRQKLQSEYVLARQKEDEARKEAAAALLEKEEIEREAAEIRARAEAAVQAALEAKALQVAITVAARQRRKLSEAEKTEIVASVRADKEKAARKAKQEEEAKAAAEKAVKAEAEQRRKAEEAKALAAVEQKRKAEEAKALAVEQKRKAEEAKALAVEQKRKAEEAERLAKAEKKAKADEEKRAKDEAERKAKTEAEEKAKVEAEMMAKAEAEEKVKLKAKAEAEDKAKLEAKLKAKAEAEERAKLEAKMKAKAEAEEKARVEAEMKAKAEAEEKARVEAEMKAKAEAEEKARVDAEMKVKAEAEEKARVEAEMKAKAEAEENARVEAEMKAKAEAEEKARVEAEMKAKTEAEEKARVEAEMKAKEEAEEKAKVQAEMKARAEAEGKAQAEAEIKEKEEEEEKLKLEAAKDEIETKVSSEEEESKVVSAVVSGQVQEKQAPKSFRWPWQKEEVVEEVESVTKDVVKGTPLVAEEAVQEKFKELLPSSTPLSPYVQYEDLKPPSSPSPPTVEKNVVESAVEVIEIAQQASVASEPQKENAIEESGENEQLQRISAAEKRKETEIRERLALEKAKSSASFRWPWQKRQSTTDVVEAESTVEVTSAPSSTTTAQDLPRSSRPLSPYPRYPGLKPPTSPTPSPPATVPASEEAFSPINGFVDLKPSSSLFTPPSIAEKEIVETESAAKEPAVVASAQEALESADTGKGGFVWPWQKRNPSSTSSTPVPETAPQPELKCSTDLPRTSRPLSPYWRYPDLKPPASPTPSPPRIKLIEEKVEEETLVRPPACSFGNKHHAGDGM